MVDGDIILSAWVHTIVRKTDKWEVYELSSKGAKTQTKDNSVQGKKIERNSIRWMMVFYDTVIYAICWLAVYALHPWIWAKKLATVPALSVYIFAGYLFFFGFRLVFKSYKQILRYGSVSAFSRELASGLSGATLLVLLSVLLREVFNVARVPYASLIFFVAVYIVISIVVRVSYCYLYAFAAKETTLSKTIRRMVELLAHVDFDSKEPGALLHFVLEPDRTLSPINEIQNIAEQFAIRGDITNITQINKGYVNRTYRVETLSDRGHVHKYTLQRINTNVFKDVDALMDNFKLTTDHLYGKFLLPGHGKKGSVQTLRPTKDGCSYLRDDSGCWRMLTYFDGVYSLDIPDSPETFYNTGVAFGKFMKEMSDVDVNDIKEIIPNFHNTKNRYLDLEESIARDPKGRVKDVKKEIEFVRARADRFGLISEALEKGLIPTRICHNDCNLNNILFDKKTHKPVAIIDLDTVMPSSPLYDYGDSMRIGTNTAKDDEKDLSKVSCDLNLYEQYARGYLKECGEILTKEELELLPYASLIITSEDGIRFLMDHIDGDTYYNIYYPGQNLDRSRTQLKLVEDMEKKLPEIKEILRKIYAELGLTAEIN